VNVELDWHERQMLTELLSEYRRGVNEGSICGFPQSKEDELADADRLLNKLGDS